MAKMKSETGPLDELDANIISVLQADARTPNTNIAQQLGVAEGTVRNRIARLIGEDIITFGVWADPLKIGYQTYAYIEILVDPTEVENIAKTLAGFPEVVFVGVCTGSFDIHVAVLFKSNEHMYDFITKRLNIVKGVLRTSTSTVMRIVKRDLHYPIPGATIPAGRAASAAQRAKLSGKGQAVRAMADGKSRSEA
jgi:Lrp/AsnC family transcriptional regulator, regulator for asnA, asnC and gidA